MSEIQNLPATAADEVVARKIQAWGQLGAASHQLQERLQMMKEKSLSKIKDLPSDLNKIADYDAALKVVNSEKLQIVNLRKELTSKLEAISTRMMQPEKEFARAIQLYETALISVKKSKQAAELAAKYKTDEIARIREQFSNHISASNAGYETLVTNKIMKCYEHALNTNIPETDIPATMEKMKAALTIESFTIQQPPVTLVYANQEQVNAIWVELHSKYASLPSAFLTTYHFGLRDKFEFYGIALKNKEASLEHAKAEQAKELQAIADRAEDEKVAAKLETIAPMEPTIVAGGKALKNVYVLDMPDNEQTAIILMTAMAANWSTAKNKLRVTIWSNLSIKQMGAALVALKNDDEKFSVSGLVFKKEDKL